MAVSIYRFSEVEAKKPSPVTTNMAIKDVLRAKDDACYIEMEQYLRPPGVSGSKAFDQAYAVSTLLRHDAKNGGRLADIMGAQGMSHRLLWDRLQAVLRSVGFQIKHGRLVGLIEDLRSKEEAENGDIGQPDIE